MKLTTVRISNFQSYGPEATTIRLEPITFFLGPNGAGKTGVLQAIARMFAFDPSLRRIQGSDFHVNQADAAKRKSVPSVLWLEAEFEFPETKDDAGKYPTIPSHFAHMRLEAKDGVPKVRFRLEAEMDEDGEIEELIYYVLQIDKSDTPVKKVPVPKYDRSTIQVHYLPARRDPTDHISYAANSLLGRALRAADWQTEREDIATLAKGISEALAGNKAVEGISQELTAFWMSLHKGSYYTDPNLIFERNEIEILLRHLTINFSAGPDGNSVDFARLSDGQKSILYVSLVLAMQSISRRVLSGELDAFNTDKLRPAIFTIIAMEEPENSLSPHYLGRIVKNLTDFSKNHDGQAIIATHSPSLIKRVPPESLRYLRLDKQRQTVVKNIVLPDVDDEAHKFVREAVQSFTELYFSRFVILGEGDSEEIVLPRLLQAWGLPEDDSSISIVPLGGRHVNHFWRLLQGLDIPYLTLIDLDLCRYQGGWGRIRYAAQQLLNYSSSVGVLTQKHIDKLPKWDAEESLLGTQLGQNWLKFLENMGVFFSSPLDLDLALIQKFPAAYEVKAGDLQEPDEKTLKSVLGKSHIKVDQYLPEVQKYFDIYHQRFKLRSKPVAHLTAFAKLTDSQLKTEIPEVLLRLLAITQQRVKELPE